MLLRISLIIVFTLILGGCAIPIESSHTPILSSEKHLPNYQQSLDPDVRVDLAKKRKSYISGIRKGDYYSLRNNAEEALSYYLQVAEKIPNDQVVRKKIGHVYFLQKNWKAAYENYIQVPIAELSGAEQTEMFQSLFFDESQLDRIGEIMKIPIGSASREYFRVMDVCYTGIHNCVVTIDSYSGSSLEVHLLDSTITGSALISPDFQYRNLNLAVKLYEQGMYGASSRIAEEILRNRPDYLEVMKILGFSDYELGKYGESKKYLLAYLEKNPKDLESTLRMGEIFAHAGDLRSSNLYLNNAILAGYTPKTDLERRLAYNYSLLGDMAGLMKVMNYLLQETDVREDDYAVAISLALSEGDLARARTWSLDGIKQFQNSPMLTPLYIETLRLLGERDAATMVIENNDSSLTKENPNFLLQKGILLFEQGKYDAAKTIFTQLIAYDDWPGVVEEASTYITSIQAMKTQSGSSFFQ